MARLGPHYLKTDWTKNTEILSMGGHWCGLQNRKRGFEIFHNLVKLFIVQNHFKLGPQRPNTQPTQISEYMFVIYN